MQQPMGDGDTGSVSGTILVVDDQDGEPDYARYAMARARAVLDDLRLLRELQRAHLADVF